MWLPHVPHASPVLQIQGVQAIDYLCLLWLPAFHTRLFKQTVVQTKHNFPAACGLIRNLNHWPACKEGWSAVDSPCLLAAHLQQTRAKYNFHLSFKYTEFCDENLHWGNHVRIAILKPGFICPSICFWQEPVAGASGEHKPFPTHNKHLSTYSTSSCFPGPSCVQQTPEFYPNCVGISRTGTVFNKDYFQNNPRRLAGKLQKLLVGCM